MVEWPGCAIVIFTEYIYITGGIRIRFGRLLYINEALWASLHRRDNMNVTYILRCSDGTLYTGWTNDIEKRLEAHNQGHGAKYTRGRTPVELVYLESFDTRQEAMKREAAIKKLPRKDKLQLIASGHATGSAYLPRKNTS